MDTTKLTGTVYVGDSIELLSADAPAVLTVEGGNAEFDEGFKEWINSDSVNLDNNGGNDMIAAVSVMGFDAYNVALEAIKLAGSTDPVAIKDALWDVNYDGITGNITFGENGDAVRDTAYIKISDNVAVAWTDGGTQTVA